jgi:NADH:ubiquinone oxidoreductase subunit F (NADH-binding)
MTALAEAVLPCGPATTLLLDPAGNRPMLPPRATPGPDPDLAALIDRAGLVGRGGGGFPTARKIAAVVASSGRRRPIVIANGAEGEPLSRKDEVLLITTPHLVLDGLALAARAVGAVTADLCVHAGSPALPVLAAALRARPDADVFVSLRQVPRRYVASEASALASLLAGGAALPTTRPPHLAERRVLVLNVETLAGIARALRCGPGAATTQLVTVAGAIRNPGVAEVPVGEPLGLTLARAGLGRGDVGAVLAGGFGGGWLSGRDAWVVPLTSAALRAAGAALGPGLMIVLPPYACGVAETARIARYLAGESAGQCGPCVFGLPAIASAL